ncbi:MAG: signal peptidase [Actinomycetota bacterium]|nr:signal peptidase [Actinomycetota bacterium]
MPDEEIGSRRDDETTVVPTTEGSLASSETVPAPETTDEDPGTPTDTTTGDTPETTALPATGTSSIKFTPKPVEKKKSSRSLLAKVTEIPILILLAFGIAILIKTFLVQAFYIPSGSMIPTLHVGDRVLVEKVSFVFGGPDRNDIVVFEKNVFGISEDLPWTSDARNFFRELLGLPTGQTEDYIKRVVAVGGDRISYNGTPRVLTVNDEKVAQPFVKGGTDRSSPTLTSSDCKRLNMDKAGPGCRVPAGMVFVMGDNRSNSEDSRILGPIDEDKIVGRAFLIIWPAGDFGTL